MNVYFEIVKKRVTHPDIEEKLDYWNEIREINQQIIISGLAKTDFFDKAVFMGGTALKLLHGLNRYSEDLDFSFLKPCDNFNWKYYYDQIRDYAKDYGCELSYSDKSIRNINRSLLKDELLNQKIHEEKIVDVKWTKKKGGISQKVIVQLDIGFRKGSFDFEEKILHFPEDHKVKAYDIHSLCAGKLNAILTRRDKYGNSRDEGRDWFDFKWLVNNKIEPNYAFLYEKLSSDKNYKGKEYLFNEEFIKNELLLRAEKLNYNEINYNIEYLTIKKTNLNLILIQ
jgi:predicted nucleotidyltransferase component of viral defense system